MDLRGIQWYWKRNSFSGLHDEAPRMMGRHAFIILELLHIPNHFGHLCIRVLSHGI